MPERIAAVLDLDDNLLQTRAAKYPHHQAVARKFYDFDLPTALMDEKWGNGLRDELPHFYGKPDATDEEFQAMKANFESVSAEFPKHPQRDAPQFLRALDEAGVLRAILTALDTDIALADLERTKSFGDEFYIAASGFAFVHGADLTTARIKTWKKPHPGAAYLAKRLLAAKGITPERTIYVGDSLSDGIFAHASGWGFVGTTTGRTPLTGKDSFDSYRSEHTPHGFIAYPTLMDGLATILENPEVIHRAA